MTATCRVGFHRYTFDAAGDAWVVFGLGEEIMLPMSDVSVRRDGLKGLTGYVENAGTRRRKKPATIHFQTVFDRDIEEIRAWRNGEFVDFSESLSGPDTGIAVRFQMDKGEALLLKVALSYCDAEGARRNLEAELPHWDFDRVRTGNTGYLEHVAESHRSRRWHRSADDQVLHRPPPCPEGSASGQ